MIGRILSADPSEVMPPPESNLVLTEREKKLLIKWEQQGAEWKPHWAFTLPTESETPEVKETDWVKNEIDHFVLAKLEEKSFAPSESATKEKLLRRASFDLTGLPPTVSEVESFLTDAPASAFEKQVDRLLASPAYNGP